MAEGVRNLVGLIAQGTDHERSSAAFTIANGGRTAGKQGAATLSF